MEWSVFISCLGGEKEVFTYSKNVWGGKVDIAQYSKCLLKGSEIRKYVGKIIFLKNSVFCTSYAVLCTEVGYSPRLYLVENFS